MARHHAIEAQIGLSSRKSEAGGIVVYTDQSFKIAVPERFTVHDIMELERAVEKLALIVREHPESTAEFLNAVLDNDFAHAKKVAHKTGLQRHIAGGLGALLEAAAEIAGGITPVGWLAIIVATVYAVNTLANQTAGDDEQVNQPYGGSDDKSDDGAAEGAP